ncbi:MAG: DUF4349 domain-containing protein [Oscillospiraceae bacterium]|nr:DUF4349 domain-containing protein [Oscillospiraceae bacterium]
MQIRRIFALFLVVMLLISVLAACGANTESKSDRVSMDVESDSMNSVPEKGLSKTEESSQTQTPVNQKLIRKVYMDAETEDLDSLLSQVEQRIAQLGGYVESREIYNGSSRNTKTRYGDLTIRIPAENLDQFVDQVHEVSNITSLRETTDDVTLDYVATESRVKALQTEETRLLELLSLAENMNDLLTIESKLTDVRTELEQVQSILKVYDNQVNYSTIYLDVTEVETYTVVEEPKTEGFFERIGNGFVRSLNGVWTLVKELVIFWIVYMPYWGIIVLGALITYWIIRIRKKKENQQRINK